MEKIVNFILKYIFILYVLIFILAIIVGIIIELHIFDFSLGFVTGIFIAGCAVYKRIK